MEAGEPLQKKPRIDSEDRQVPLPGAADGFGGSSSHPGPGQQRSWAFAPQYGDKQLPGQAKSTGNASATGKNVPDRLQPDGGVGAAAPSAENGLSTTQEAKEVIRRPPVRVGGSQYEAPADLEGSRPSDAKSGEALGAYVDRETSLMDMEKRGEIAFHYITNDDSPKSLIWLMGLKNIFSKQLPNMPRTYICRLVLDRRHRSVVLVRRDDTVLGGITYRVFHKQRVGEIAFCAISSTEQVKGFGTRLMNHTKENARTQDNLAYFLTYADNNAVGYFLKQGFTKEVTLQKEEWLGFIKDYDGGTLMECRLHPKVPYTSFPDMVKVQRKHLDEVVAELSNSHIVHPGLQHPTLPNGQRCRIHAKDIPGVLEAGWSPDAKEQAYRIRTRNGMFEAVSPATLQQLMREGLSMMMKQDDMWPFREPVNGEEVLDYYDVVKDPIDLSLIQQRLHSQQYYVTLEMFVQDFRRMFQNARVYNAADTVYFKLANKMDQLFQQWVDEHLLFMK